MQYDFTLAAGAAQSFDVVGKFIKYQNGTGLIRVRMSMGEYVDLLPGQGVFSVDYTRFTVTDRSGAQNVGALLAGDFDFRDSRITGDVNVIDSAKNSVLAGVNFATNRSITASAGNFIMAQLYNPAASGKRIAINSIYAMSDGAGPLYLCGASGELAGSVVNPWNKRLQGPPSAAKSIWAYDPAGTFLGIGPQDQFGRVVMSPNVGLTIPFRGPIVVMPGYGFSLLMGTAGASLNYLIDLEEF